MGQGLRFLNQSLCNEVRDAGMGLRIGVTVVGADLVTSSRGRKSGENRRHGVNDDILRLKL